MVQQQIIFRNLVYSYDDIAMNKLSLYCYYSLDYDIWPKEIYDIYQYMLSELCLIKSTVSEES